MNKPCAALLLLGLGAALGLAIALAAPAPTATQPIEWLDRPRSLHNFNLETAAGAFNRQTLLGRWTIVVFGFLNCPDICPTSLSQLAQLADRLAGEPGGEVVDFVFVSVDPGRDSVAGIDEYVRHFDASILGVTGSEEQLTQFAGDLGVRFNVSPDEGDYTVAHSITFTIIGPGAKVRGRFRPGFDVPRLARHFTSRLLSNGGPSLHAPANTAPLPRLASHQYHQNR